MVLAAPPRAKVDDSPQPGLLALSSMSDVSRRAFLQSGAIAAASSVLPATAAAELHPSPAGRPNVLFIAIDDLNVSLGCYGNRVVKTPYLDALAARGTVFHAAHCQYPLCGPSRASLMTGLAPDTTRVYALATFFRNTIPDAVTLPQLFQRNGYSVARVGKVYHAGNPDQIGTDGQDDPASWQYVFNPNGVDHTQDEPLVTDFTPSRAQPAKPGEERLGSTISFYEAPQPGHAMTDSLGADEVIRLLRANRDKPFFLAYGLYRPHVPWIIPKEYFDMYPLESIQARPFHESELKLAPAPAYWTEPPNMGMDELERRKAIRAYYAATTFADAQIGRVLAELKALDLEQNTIVVFWADHGWSLGEHGQWMKQTLFEPATHVPTLFAGPGTGKPGQVCHRTTEHLDIYPTLVELCSLEGAPQNLHGSSLVPLLRDPAAPWEKPAISQIARPPQHTKTMGYSLRNQRYRYTRWQGEQTGEELYDYEADPHEWTNLANDPSVQSLKARLRRQLESITASRGRTGEVG